MQILALIGMALFAALAGSLITVMYYRVKLADLKSSYQDALAMAADNGYVDTWENRRHGKHRAKNDKQSTFALAK